MFKSEILKRAVKKFISGNLAVICAYAGIVSIITFPIIFKVNTHILGSFGGYRDLGWELWVQWIIKDSITHSRSLFFTDMIHFPVGFSLLSLANFLNAALGVLLQFFFSLTASYNILCLLNLTFNAFSAYLLMRYLFKDKFIAFFCAAIFAFNSYTLTEISYGRLLQASLSWVPLYILFLFKLEREEKKTNAFWAAFFIFLSFLSSWHYGIFLLIFSLFFIPYRFMVSGKLRGEYFKKIAAFLAYFSLLVFPVACFYFIFGTVRLDMIMPPKYYTDIFSATIRNSLDIGFLFRNAKGYIPDISRKASFLAMAIAILPLFFRRKKPLFWIFSAALFYILCLGPFLKVSAENLHAPLTQKMPYLVFYNFFPFFWLIRWPDRFVIMLILSLAVLAGYNLKWLENKIKLTKSARIVFYTLLSVFLILEIPALKLVYKFPVSVSKKEAPEFYYKLAEEKNLAIIEYPFFSAGAYGDYPQATMYGYYQTVHKKPIQDGMCSFILLPQPGQEEFVHKNTFLSFLLSMQRQADYDAGFKDESIRELREAGFKYLVVHNDYFKNGDAGLINRRLTDALGNPVRYPDEINVYLLGS